MIVRFANIPFKKWFSSFEDISGNSFPLIVGSQVFDQLQRYMGKVLVGESVHFQISVGREEYLKYLDVNLTPDFDERNIVQGFIFHSTDVTAQNRTERALRDYFENATIGLHWVNSDGIIVWANPAELKMLGYTEEEYVGQHISKFHYSRNVIKDILLRLGHKETLHNYEAELLCKDGSLKHVAINSSVLWEGDKFIHTRCFTIDITEQKKAALAVKESEERFKMMANLVPLIIWTTDETGNCNFLNVRWKESTGKDVHEGLGQKWLDLVHPEDRDNIRQAWLKSSSKKRPFEAKFRYANGQGGYTINYANSSPRYNSSGNFAGYIGILQDISTQEQITSSLEKIVMDRTEDLNRRNAELRQAERALQEKNNELQKTNKELSSFAHIASHDLQEPLRKIQTFTGRVLELEESNLSEKGKVFFTRIESAAERMRALIIDLLAYSKSTDATATFELTNLNTIWTEVVNELEIKIEEKKAKIENLGLPELRVVRFQFHQLLLNLMTNSLKFSKSDSVPHIVIRSGVVKGVEIGNPIAKPNQKYHHISFTDNGIGFDQQYADTIFEIFQRLHPKSEFEGTGIGLAICKKIVENHNGFITAEGNADQGATFHVYIPAG
jgi:PAS domain S-box-containing protein